jgi:nitrite reductase/ring-hydroxylating ferredoxin subunit
MQHKCLGLRPQIQNSGHKAIFAAAQFAALTNAARRLLSKAGAGTFPPQSPVQAGSPQSTAGLCRAVERRGEMAEKFVAKASEFPEGDRRIVFVGDNEIGVFRHAGQFYAYSNFCLHQGGPACEGLTIAKVEERLRPDKTSQGLYFSETEMNFVCPWHGMEYDMKTGECVSDRKMKLKKYQVLQKGDEIYVVA